VNQLGDGVVGIGGGHIHGIAWRGVGLNRDRLGRPAETL
jgi:hypothetical protein